MRPIHIVLALVLLGLPLFHAFHHDSSAQAGTTRPAPHLAAFTTSP